MKPNIIIKDSIILTGSKNNIAVANGNNSSATAVGGNYLINNIEDLLNQIREKDKTIMALTNIIADLTKQIIEKND